MSSTDTKRPTRVAVLVWDPCINSSRAIKEAESLVSADFEVTVFCLSAPEAPSLEKINGVTYRRLQPLWSPQYITRYIKRAIGALTGFSFEEKKFFGEKKSDARDNDKKTTDASKPSMWLLWQLFRLVMICAVLIDRIRRFSIVHRTYRPAVMAFAPDVIHAHDLLTLAAAVPLSRKLNIPFVYDTHELALHVSNPPKGLSRWRYRRLESDGIRRAHAVITVSDSIADYLSRDYSIERPIVLLNAPAIGATNEASLGDIRSHLGLARDVPLAIFSGGVGRLRGTDLLVEAISYLDEVHLAFVGGRSESADRRPLKIAAEKLGIGDRIHFLPSVPVDQVVGYITSADIGVIPYQNSCLNHDYCMPNKLFECAAAGVPLVVASLTELRRFVEINEIGVTVDERDAHAIAEGIKHVLSNLNHYRPSADRLENIRQQYTWPAQAEKFVALYRQLLSTEMIRGSV